MNDRDDEIDLLNEITDALSAAADRVGAPRPMAPIRAERRGRFLVVEGGKKVAAITPSNWKSDPDGGSAA